MTQSGYIPIPRSLFDDPIWLEKRTYTKAEALTDLYRRAAYLPHEKYVDGKLVQVGIGEVVDSVRYLATAWGWAKTSVHDFLKRLEKAGHVSLKTRTGISVITVTFSATYYAEAAEARTATGQQPDSNRTATGQQPDKGEEDKEKKEEKEGKVEATPAPPSFNPSILQSSNPSIPGTEAFDLLKRIGKNAAQIWTQSNAEQTFGAKADLALEWMELRCRFGKPFISHQEFTTLAKLYAEHTAADIRIMIDYSAGKYPDLYTDAIKKAKKAQQGQHRPEIIQKDRFTKERQQAQPNGLIKFD